jgi:hypothetical protein
MGGRLGIYLYSENTKTASIISLYVFFGKAEGEEDFEEDVRFTAVTLVLTFILLLLEFLMIYVNIVSIDAPYLHRMLLESYNYLGKKSSKLLLNRPWKIDSWS